MLGLEQQYAMGGSGMLMGGSQNGGSYPHSNIYIKNLPQDVDTEALKQLFSTYGVIENARLVQATSPNGFNYGFVKYSSVEQASAAIDGMHKAQVGNSYLEVKFAAQDLRNTNVGRTNGGYVGTPSDNLYVRNIPNSYSEDDVQNLFSQAGLCKETKLLASSDPARLNGALVRMASADDARRAIDDLNNKPPPGGSQPLLIKFADTDEDKARKRATQSSEMGQNRYSPYGDVNRQPLGGVQTPPNLYNQQVAYPMQAPYAGFDQFYQGVGAALQPQPYGLTPQPVAQPQTGMTSVYVKNIPHNEINECELFLYRKFAPLGAIVSVFVMQDKESGTAKGVGFVNYADGNAAQIAIQQLNGQQFDDKVLGVALQNQRSGGGQRGGRM